MEGMTNENGWKAREGKWNREMNRKRKNQRLKKKNGWRNRKKLDRGQKTRTRRGTRREQDEE
jgi:hypothetical protein